MNYKIKHIAGLGLVSVLAAGSALAQTTPLEDLEAGVTTMGTIGNGIVAVTVTLFLIAMAIRFFRKGARG